MYEVVIERQAQKELAKIPPPFFQQIVQSLNDLANNPRPHGYKKLKGRPGYRIRTGDYRIIYTIHDNVLTVMVLSVGHRKDVYD